MIPRPYKALLLTATILVSPGLAWAAMPPDAGQTVQQLKEPPQPSAAATGLTINIAPNAPVAPGGQRVTLKAVHFSGNSIFTRSQLLAITGNPEGKNFDMAGLRSLTDRITAAYHTAGYPFARAFLPAQTLKDGHLNITIVEGRYGAVHVDGDTPSRNAQAVKFLSGLQPGTTIESAPLERATLILDDQPGYSLTPIMRPGQDLGTGDLDVRIKRDDRFGGEVGLDNYGNRYTGRARGRVDLYANSPFIVGDQIKLNSLYTEEDMWYGALDYNAPLGYSGLRGHVNYAQTYYQLSQEFDSLDAHGTAKIATGGLSYPLLRSQKTNLNAAVNYQHKWLVDQQDTTATRDVKSSDSLPVTLSFDHRDQLGGNGITYGTFGWTQGILDLDSSLDAIDQVTAKTKGGFDKFNLDVARLQALPARFSAFGRFSGQLAADNLDSSESFGLGGPNGVRAYPTGEGYGDEGYLTQLELRYQAGDFAPYTFYDAGHVRINNNPWTAGNNERDIGGAGFGLRFNHGGWNADATVAWRVYGGEPNSDSQDHNPLFWISTGYKF